MPLYKNTINNLDNRIRMDFKKLLNTIIKVILPLCLGLLLFWFVYRNIHFGELWNIIKKGVRYDIILYSLGFGLIANVIRGYRWGLLVDSIGEKFRLRNMIYAVLGNYAINIVLPLRAGELWRCGIITKYEKIPFSKLFGTLVVDRAFDTLMVALITFSIIFINFGFFSNFFSNNPELLSGIYGIFDSVWLYVGIIGFAVLCFVVFYFMRNTAIVQKIKAILLDIWTGIKSVWMLKKKGLFIVETFLIWICYFFYFYITFYAFGFTKDLGVQVGLITFVMSSIAVAVPVQGAIGPWHFMVIASLTIFGVDKTDAAAFALVVHTVQTLWTGLCGLFGIVALPIANRDVPTTTEKIQAH